MRTTTPCLERFDALLAHARRHPMTDAEREEQARNFVAGNVGLSCPEVTREVVDRVCDELGKMSAVE